jgi:hypothetical protein
MLKTKVIDDSFKAKEMTPENIAIALNHLSNEIEKVTQLEKKIDKITWFIISSILVPIFIFIITLLLNK